MWLIACCELKTQADIWGVCVHFVYSYLIGFIQMQFSASPSIFLRIMTHSQTLVWCSYFPLIRKSVFFITRVVAELTILFSSCVSFDPVPSTSHLVKVHQSSSLHVDGALSKFPGPVQAFCCPSVVKPWLPGDMRRAKQLWLCCCFARNQTYFCLTL